MRLYQRLRYMFIKQQNNTSTNTQLDLRNICCSQCGKKYNLDRYDYDTIMESKLPFICDECRKN